MGYTQPNDGTATYGPQEQGFGQEQEILATAGGLYPIKCVLDGAAPTDGSTGLEVDVAAGVLWYNGSCYYEAGATVTCGTADGTNPRMDYVVYDQSAAAYQVVAGTAAAAPDPPLLTADQILIAEVYIPTSATVLSSDEIIDKRIVGATPPDIDVWYVDTDNGLDPGASTWAGHGRTWDFAYKTMSACNTDAAVDDLVYIRGTYAAFTLTKALRVIGTDEANSAVFSKVTATARTLTWREGVLQVTGAVTITLPDADDYEGKNYLIQRRHATNTVTIQPGTFSIVKDGTFNEGTAVLDTDGAAVGLYSDGTDWHVAGDRGTVTYT